VGQLHQGLTLIVGYGSARMQASLSGSFAVTYPIAAVRIVNGRCRRLRRPSPRAKRFNTILYIDQIGPGTQLAIEVVGQK
jgi:hypothetical protein